MSKTTLKARDIAVDAEKLTTERIASITDKIVQDLAEVSGLGVKVGKIHINVHFQHSKIVNKTIIVTPNG